MTALGEAHVIQGNALALPLPDASVDLICTSPPYFGLRSYQDGGQHYDGQIGSEATPAEFLDALLSATREMVRVLKPSGSIFVNLGDKYSQRTQTRRSSHQPGMFAGKFEEFSETWAERAKAGAVRMPKQNVTDAETGAYIPEKSLMGIPWRYALRCIDDLGLILRAEIIWAKPNGLPESVTDRVRRSHEQWFHLVKQPRYFAAVDEIRTPHEMKPQRRTERTAYEAGPHRSDFSSYIRDVPAADGNPLGKLPGSVWTVPTQPLTVPPELGIDHFAAYPMEWPRRIIQGWTPNGVCTACGQGRRPVVNKQLAFPNSRFGEFNMNRAGRIDLNDSSATRDNGYQGPKKVIGVTEATIIGYTCACAAGGDFDCCQQLPPTTPAVVLDPFGGTGTTALVAKALGRIGISIDLSADYCRLAEWRCNDPRELAAALQVEKPEPVSPDQMELFA